MKDRKMEHTEYSDEFKRIHPWARATFEKQSPYSSSYNTPGDEEILKAIKKYMALATKLDKELKDKILEEKSETNDVAHENFIYFFNTIKDNIKIIYSCHLEYVQIAPLERAIDEAYRALGRLLSLFPKIIQFEKNEIETLRKSVVSALLTEKNRIILKYELNNNSGNDSINQKSARERADKIDSAIENILGNRRDLLDFFQEDIVQQLYFLRDEATYKIGFFSCLSFKKSDGYHNISKIIIAVKERGELENRHTQEDGRRNTLSEVITAMKEKMEYEDTHSEPYMKRKL